MCPHSNFTTCYHCLSAPRVYVRQSMFDPDVTQYYHLPGSASTMTNPLARPTAYFVPASSDLMAILPYPVAPPKNPNNKNEKKAGRAH